MNSLTPRVSPQSELLEALAARCEREAPSRELDERIWRWVNDSQLFFKGWRFDLEWAPKFTASLDAAVTLVPEDHWRRSGSYSYSWAEVGAVGGRYDEFHTGHARNEAMAICMAALRARAALSKAGSR